MGWKDFEEFSIYLPKYDLLSTGADGGHYYILADIRYNGKERRIVVFFSKKSDEELIKTSAPITVKGRIWDQGIHQSLLLNEAEIIDK